MERTWRGTAFFLFGVIISSAPGQDQPFPTALLVSFPDAPLPWKTCSGPRTIRVTAAYSSGRASPYNGVGRVLSPTDARCTLNGMEIPIVNGVGALPNSVVWYKAGENLVQVSSKDGALKGEAKVMIETQDKDIKLEIEKPEPKPGHLWAGGVFKARIKATVNGKPVEDLLLKALDSKGVIISPQTLVTDQNGLVDCELFTPNFVCPTTPNGNGTLEGDARFTAKFFVDTNGDNTADNGEPTNGFDEIPITEPCPQELIPCALELCRILAGGGVIVPGPVLGPTPTSVSTLASRKPDKEEAERAILRAACRFLEDQVIGFINSGKWNGRFSAVVKRLEHVIKFLRPVERARPAVQRLECAISLMRGNPDVIESKPDLVETHGRLIVHVNYRDFVRILLFGTRRRNLGRGEFTDCFKPAVTKVETKGPGSGRPVSGVEAEQPAFEFCCDGEGKVEVGTEISFRPETVIIIDDGGGIDASRVPRGSTDVIGETLSFVLKDEIELLQELPDIDVDTNRNGKVEPGKEDDEGEDQDVVYLGTRGALVFANADNDDKDLQRDFENGSIDGGNDLLDVIQVVIRRIPNLAAGARVVLLVDNPQAVRVFTAHAVGATTLIGPGTSAVVQIPRAPIIAGDVVLELEGISNGRQVTLNLSIVQTGRITSFDEAKVLVTPWLMTSNIDPAEQVLVTAWPARAVPTDRDNSVFLADFLPKLGRAINPANVTSVSGKLQPGTIAEFTQDPLEFGYQRIRGSTPEASRTMPVAVDLPYHSGASKSHGDFAENTFLAPDRGVLFVEPTVDPTGGGDFGGNLELIPPIRSHPLGVALTGDNATRSLIEFIEKNREQTRNPRSTSPEMVLLPFNAPQTNIDHVDEVINVVPNPQSTDGFAIVLGDIRRAISFVPPRGSPIGDRLTPYRIREADVARVEATLNAIQNELTRVGVPASSIVRLPVFYPLISDLELNDEFGLPNAINLQVVNGIVFVPEPSLDDPTDTRHRRKIPFPGMSNDITRQLRAAGVPRARIVFVDTRELSFFGGEVHCATNVRRTPPR